MRSSCQPARAVDLRLQALHEVAAFAPHPYLALVVQLDFRDEQPRVSPRALGLVLFRATALP